MSEALWAKKQIAGRVTPTVATHCGDVCRTADAISAVISVDLAASLSTNEHELNDLLPLLRATSLLHDLGKTNSAFQQMLHARAGDACRQPVRHEVLGAWLLADPDFYGGWLSKLRGDDEIWPVLWAVAGHHLKMADPARGATLFDTGSGVTTVRIPLSTGDAPQIVMEAGSHLKHGAEPPRLNDCRFDTCDDDDKGLEQRIGRFVEASCRAWNRLRRNPQVVRRTALLKALLIAADVAGSALTADDREPSEWVPQALSVRIDAAVLESIIKKGTKNKDPHPFQQRVGACEGSATIVIAGCGNGKTTAAYLWAQKHAIGRKLWFTYPTTGTASAGYQGYLLDHPDLVSELIHSRSDVDLETMRESPEDGTDDASLKLESLRAWDQQAIVCTVDTVLGLLQTQRRPLFSFPAIATGAFVFDEIHSYDACLFGSLLRFLQTFPGAPVLLMSASIPPKRLEAIHAALGGRAREAIRGDEIIEGYQRYEIRPVVPIEDCQSEVARALAADKKVLWVCNTVSEAVATARDAEDWSGVPHEQILVYHSRFRYGDRVARQQEVLTEFAYAGEPGGSGRAKPVGGLVIATQVCEMSLDISADLMVTAECPLPAFVQRLGRLNRYATSDDPQPCLVYAFEGDPYNERPELAQTRGDYRIAMAAMRDAVKELGDRGCSQHDLAMRLDRMIDVEKFETYSAWLDDGWLSEPAAVRDGDRTITVVRKEDVRDIETDLLCSDPTRRRKARLALMRMTIPMPYRRDFRPSGKANGYPIAEEGTISYCNSVGAKWQ